MTEVLVSADFEGAVVDWLKTITAVSTLVSSRVFFGYPKGSATPLVIVTQESSLPDVNTGLETVNLKFDCWSGVKNKIGATNLKNAVIAALRSFEKGTLNSGVYAYSFLVTNAGIWLPDPSTDQARYVVLAQMTARAV